MMTFMKSKLTKMTGKEKKNYIFQKGKPYEISRTDICAYIHTIYIYIYMRTGFYYSSILLVYPIRIYTKCKKNI